MGSAVCAGLRTRLALSEYVPSAFLSMETTKKAFKDITMLHWQRDPRCYPTVPDDSGVRLLFPQSATERRLNAAAHRTCAVLYLDLCTHALAKSRRANAQTKFVDVDCQHKRHALEPCHGTCAMQLTALLVRLVAGSKNARPMEQQRSCLTSCMREE